MKCISFPLTAVVMLLVAACGSTRPAITGAPPEIREKELLEKVYEAENDFQTLALRAVAHFSNEDISQSFRLQARMIRDSLIWLDIADPLIGIKVARAVVYKDSVAFVDNFNKKYYTGDIRSLQQKIKMDLGFHTLQQLLAGNLILTLDKDYNMYYRPGHYLLVNYPVDGADSVVHSFGNAVLNNVQIEPPFHKASRQSTEEPAMGRKYELHYNGIRPVNELLYPEEIEVMYFRNTASRLNLKIREVERDKPLNYPFTIPVEYERMQ